MKSSKAQHLIPYLLFFFKKIIIYSYWTILSAVCQSSSYAIDMLLALPDQYLPLKTIEIIFVHYLPLLPIFTMGDV